jgi:hypothetical protein
LYSTHVLSEPTVSVEVVEYSKTGLLLSSLLDLLTVVRLGLTGAEIVCTTVSAENIWFGALFTNKSETK